MSCYTDGIDPMPFQEVVCDTGADTGCEGTDETMCVITEPGAYVTTCGKRCRLNDDCEDFDIEVAEGSVCGSSCDVSPGLLAYVATLSELTDQQCRTEVSHLESINSLKDEITELTGVINSIRDSQSSLAMNGTALNELTYALSKLTGEVATHQDVAGVMEALTVLKLEFDDKLTQIINGMAGGSASEPMDVQQQSCTDSPCGVEIKKLQESIDNLAQLMTSRPVVPASDVAPVPDAGLGDVPGMNPVQCEAQAQQVQPQHPQTQTAPSGSECTCGPCKDPEHNSTPCGCPQCSERGAVFTFTCGT